VVSVCLHPQSGRSHTCGHLSRIVATAVDPHEARRELCTSDQAEGRHVGCDIGSGHRRPIRSPSLKIDPNRPFSRTDRTKLAFEQLGQTLVVSRNDHLTRCLYAPQKVRKTKKVYVVQTLQRVIERYELQRQRGYRQVEGQEDRDGKDIQL